MAVISSLGVMAVITLVSWITFPANSGLRLINPS